MEGVLARTSVLACGFLLAGVALGTVSGLLPGLHANNMAFLLAGVAPSIPGPRVYVAMAMLAAGVVHTFLDVVPSLALGVPDAAMAAVALPGHRLVLAGRGREALRLSALGSGGAVVLAIPLAIPVTRVMTAAWPTIRAHLTAVILAVAAGIVLTEGSPVAMAGAAVSLVASGLLGVATLELSPAAPLSAGGMLAPLFAGLFGAPVLIDAVGGGGIPPQDDPAVAVAGREVAGLTGLGTLAGAVVGYVPAISSAIAATGALLAVPGRYGARGFVVATSGVNTANAVFALFALLAIGSPRTGVLVAVGAVGAPVSLPHMLVAVAAAGGVGFLLVPTLGDRYLMVVGRVDATALSVMILLALAGLSYLFAGRVGVVAYLAATVVGLVPPRFQARRASLMGVLFGPLVVG
jgi:putative membrane protein